MSEQPIPPFVGDPAALVVVDLSHMLNAALRDEETDGMVACCVGWLCSLLSFDPAHLCVALDSTGRTFRHDAQHPTDETWAYKANRPPKPEGFSVQADKIVELVDLHSIPILWADGYEADDVIATVTRRARDVGYRVWVYSPDKDLASLVEEDDVSGTIVGTFSRVIKGTGYNVRRVADVVEKFGVRPEQMTDWLAIAGDSGDNVPGVDGLGPKGARLVLGAHGTLEGALAAPLSDVDALTKTIGEAKLAAGKCLKPSKKSGLAPDPDRAARIMAERETLKVLRDVARAHATLCAAADVARFSRTLTALDNNAPIRIPWDGLAVGGFRVDELRARYTKLGFTTKAAEVPYFPKSAAWAGEIGDER